MKKFSLSLLSFLICPIALNFACNKKLTLVKFDEGLSSEERIKLGMIYLNDGEIELAKKQFNAVVSKEMHNFTGWFYLGVSYHRLGEYQKALQAFKKASELNPQSASVHNNLADTYLRLNRLKLAEKEIERALELGGEEIGYYYLTYAELLFKKGEIEQGCSALKSAETFSEKDKALRKLVNEFRENHCAKE